MKMNRKGDERILSLYWFLMFGIIAIGVGTGVVLFYGHPMDVREKEASILMDKVAGCYLTKGELRAESLDIQPGNLESACRFNFADVTNGEYKDKIQYYVSVNIQERNYSLFYGNPEFVKFCEQKQSKINVPYCVRKKMFVLYNNELVLLEIKSVVRKVEQNAKA